MNFHENYALYSRIYDVLHFEWGSRAGYGTSDGSGYPGTCSFNVFSCFCTVEKSDLTCEEY